ncbi:hypothetical protein S83_067806, partial [Arachis hypogaea]
VIYTFPTEIEAIWLHGPRTRNRVSVSKSSQTPPLGGCTLSFLTYVGVPQQLMVSMLLNEAEDDAVIVHDLNRPLLTNAILKKRLYFSAPRTENEEPRLRFKVFSNTTLGWMRFIVSHIRGVPQQLMVPVLLNQVEDDAFIVHDLNRRLLTDAILKKRLYFSAPRSENEEPRLRFKVFSNTTVGWMRFIVSHIRGVPQQLMVPVLLNEVEGDAFIVHDLNRQSLTDVILKKRLYFSVRLKL